MKAVITKGDINFLTYLFNQSCMHFHIYPYIYSFTRHFCSYAFTSILTFISHSFICLLIPYPLTYLPIYLLSDPFSHLCSLSFTFTLVTLTHSFVYSSPISTYSSLPPFLPSPRSPPLFLPSLSPTLPLFSPPSPPFLFNPHLFAPSFPLTHPCLQCLPSAQHASG